VLGRRWQSEGCEHFCGTGAGYYETVLVIHDWEQFHVVHDDEAVEMLLDGGDLRAIGCKKEIFAIAVDRTVTLNAALGIEEEVVVALTGREGLRGIRDHAVEPAGSVRAGDAEKGAVSEWKSSDIMEDSGNFGMWGEGHGGGIPQAEKIWLVKACQRKRSNPSILFRRAARVTRYTEKRMPVLEEIG